MAEFAIELYGKLADIAGREITITLEDNALNRAGVLDAVAAQFPALAPFLAEKRLSFCINDAASTGEGAFAAGDHLSLLPPVSGG